MRRGQRYIASERHARYYLTVSGVAADRGQIEHAWFWVKRSGNRILELGYRLRFPEVTKQ